LWAPDPSTGKPRQRSKGGFAKKKEAQTALNEAISQLRSGSYVEASKRTVRGYLVDEWLPSVAPPNLRQSTWWSYKRLVEAYAVPAIGGVELQRLTPTHLNTMYRELLANGRRHREGGLSPKTVRNVHVMLHRALRDAVRWGFVVRNVAAIADPPKPKPAQMKVWSPAQLRTFLTHVGDDRLFAAWMLMATTGLRRGELCGLRWVDLDLVSGRAAVRFPRVVVDHAVHISEPKTARSRRSISLDPATVLALQDHEKRQAAERELVGPAGPTQDSCSPGPTGRRCTRMRSPTRSSSTSATPSSRRSGCTTSGTPTPRRPWPPASRPRS
jgi:integrase